MDAVIARLDVRSWVEAAVTCFRPHVRDVQGLWLLDARHPAATNLTRRKARADFGAMGIVRYGRGHWMDRERR